MIGQKTVERMVEELADLNEKSANDGNLDEMRSVAHQATFEVQYLLIQMSPDDPNNNIDWAKKEWMKLVHGAEATVTDGMLSRQFKAFLRKTFK